MNRLIITIQYTLPASRGAPKAEIPSNFAQKPPIVLKSVLKPSLSHPKSSLLVFFYLFKVRHRKRDGWWWDQKLTCNFLQLDFLML